MLGPFSLPCKLQPSHPYLALQEPSLAGRKPALFEQCLELLYELAASPETGEGAFAALAWPWLGWQLDMPAGLAWHGLVYQTAAVRTRAAHLAPSLMSALPSLQASPRWTCCGDTNTPCLKVYPLTHPSSLSTHAGIATLDLLRGYYGLLAPLLDTVACAPLPEGAAQRASSLHQRAWLLQVRVARRQCFVACTDLCVECSLRMRVHPSVYMLQTCTHVFLPFSAVSSFLRSLALHTAVFNAAARPGAAPR